MVDDNASAWEVASRNAAWRFYDSNENSSNKRNWFLEIEAGDIDTHVSLDAGLQTDLDALTATFYEQELAIVCKLRFPSRTACTDFCNQYQMKLCDNMDVLGAGDWFFRPADAEPMEWDHAPDAAPALAEPDEWRSSSALKANTQQDVQGVVMGANDNSFVVQQGYIEVVQNKYGGVRGTGRGFNLTPPPGSTAGIGEEGHVLAPGKMVLANSETQANLLSRLPEHNKTVYQVCCSGLQLAACTISNVRLSWVGGACALPATQCHRKRLFLVIFTSKRDNKVVWTWYRGDHIYHLVSSRCHRPDNLLQWLVTFGTDAVEQLQMDLEQGKVVRNWATNINGVDVPMTDIATETKAAQLAESFTFLGLDKNRLAKWDRRTKAGVVQDMSTNAQLTHVGGKSYSSGKNFSCMATSGDGFIAVGSMDGHIRLYGRKGGMEDYTFTNAKTQVPGLGLPITSIDVSFDSRYIVATTDKYLIVLQTFFKDDKGVNTNGFQSQMGAKTPPPKLLRLTDDDQRKVVRAHACLHCSAFSVQSVLHLAMERH